MNEGDLEKLAVEELLREAKRGRERAKDMGPAGWDKCPVPPANKRFLINTLASQLSDKNRQQRSERKKSDNDGPSSSSPSTNQRRATARSSSTGKSRTHHDADSASRKKDRHRKSQQKRNLFITLKSQIKKGQIKKSE
ncbi:PREDICTED: uncharacterized protein LOC109487217 [Branchiostoma belcheri]|uniref:Uncharacterized protein LOC109487217 n=1 Tax=Branchiostoma belcheri TaxID=7741 RepID=A0A6P5AXJ7_BRABE|nr:PREDICTED: uncharacterized protein LOC109487217 [Branchiostoma belcheri]